MSLIFSRETTPKQRLLAILFSQGVQALMLFRLAHALRMNRFARKLQVHSLLYRLNQILCGVDIDPEAKIGRRFSMPHPCGIVIGSTAEIGDDVTIMQHVTVGSRAIGDTGKRHATIGEAAFIGPGAILLGPVIIGQSAEIGAGSVVMKDVSPGQTVFGVHR